MHSLIREPLLHFLIVASVLLALNRWAEPLRKPVVEISSAAVEAQAAAIRSRLGRPLTPEENDWLPEEMLQEEILFREAQKRGMVSDNQVRETLIAMMRSTLKPVSEEPTENDLIAIRAKLPRETTTLPPQIRFEHVSFTDSETVPNNLLEKLRNGADPKSISSSTKLANPLPPTYRPQVEHLMGSDFTERVFVQPLNEWQGPLTSSQGLHFVRTISRQSEQPLAFEAIRSILETHWMNEKLREAVKREVDQLRSNYRIILPQSKARQEVAK